MKDEKKHTRGMMYSDAEVSLIQNTFGNEDLLKSVRKAMLGYELSEIDISRLSISKEAIAVLCKAFNPKINEDTAFGQSVDLLMTIKMEGIGDEELERLVISRIKLMGHIEKGLARLMKPIKKGWKGIVEFPIEGLDNEDHDYNAWKEKLTDLIARNTMVGHVDMILNSLKSLANQKVETPAETAKRVMKDSSI